MASGLLLSQVSFRHGEIVVLVEQSFHVPRGGTLVITGPNGVGKSTLLYLCAGLVPPDSGRITLDGHPVDPSHPSALIRKGVRRAFVFQQGGLVASLSALHNVALGLRYHADVFGLSEAVIDERARFCLGAVGIESPDIHSQPGLLSYGMRKRIAFARAMALEPSFAFFDDPDTGLDRENASVAQEILVSYRNDPSITLVVATNHRALIERLGVPTHELHDGRLVPSDRESHLPTSLV